jgi:hypothetical protein
MEDNFAIVSKYVSPVSGILFGAAALWYVWRVIAFRKSRDLTHPRVE